MDEAKRVVSYIKACRDAGIDVTITIDKSCSHLILNALQKQVSDKPNLEGDSYDKDGNMIYDTWTCPCCGRRYEVEYDEYDYCPKCGQKLDMSDVSI